MRKRHPFFAAATRAIGRIPTWLLFLVEGCAMGVVLVLVWKAWAGWPRIPASDPDTFGYLEPALDWLSGLGFRQVGGRDWFYPALLTLFLKTTGTFAGLMAWQKALGFGSIIFMAATWRCWVSMFPFNRWILFGLSLLGAFPIWFQSVSHQTLLFEAFIRPEAVLPFFAYAQLACLVGYLKYRWQTVRPLAAMYLGAMAIVLAYICFLLKPSWYLAFAATSAPVFIGLFGRTMSLKVRLHTPALGIVAAFLALWLPCRVFFIRDGGASVTFLPRNLFYVHAPLVDEMFSAKLAAMPDSDPRKPALKHLDDVLKSETYISAHLHDTYRTLGINPDYLLNSRKMDGALYEYAGNTAATVRSFCLASVRDAILHDPGGYARKVSIQFRYFIHPDGKTFYKEHIDLAREYRQTVAVLARRQPPNLRPEIDKLYRQYEQDAAVLGHTAAFSAKEKRLRRFSDGVARWALTVEIAFVAAFAASLLWPRLHDLRAAGWGVLALYLAPWCNAVGVCLVHALDLDRYRATYGGYFLLAMAAMALFVVAVLAQGVAGAAVRRLRHFIGPTETATSRGP